MTYRLLKRPESEEKKQKPKHGQRCADEKKQREDSPDTAPSATTIEKKTIKKSDELCVYDCKEDTILGMARSMEEDPMITEAQMQELPLRLDRQLHATTNLELVPLVEPDHNEGTMTLFDPMTVEA